MVARLTFLVALGGLLGPVGQSAVRADSEDLVRQYLNDLGATRYTITPISDDAVAAEFVGADFFEVRFMQYPVAVQPPQGLSASNVFLVFGEQVFPLPGFDDLNGLFLSAISPVGDEEDAEEVALAYLRLAEGLVQDGFYTFGDPSAQAFTGDDGSIFVAGQVTPTLGARGGSISVGLLFDPDGVLEDVSGSSTVRPGNRPICQATKLLDPDPIVRGMAEQALLCMGKSAKEYLDEQRAKAKPDLQKAIDRIWKQIVAETEQK